VGLVEWFLVWKKKFSEICLRENDYRLVWHNIFMRLRIGIISSAFPIGHCGRMMMMMAKT
jgi:hypothetical protein